MKPPRLSFLIGGAQKAGTSALARFLQAHPLLALPSGKEAHVFDAPDFEESWTAETVDARFAPHFGARWGSRELRFGDATPITMLHPRLVARVHHYNPSMRWIVLLRDPVARAISHWAMERSRGGEYLPLLPALLCEPWRLRGRHDDFSEGSPLRHHSYLLRGDYARQLDAVHTLFPRHQVLVLTTERLALQPRECLRQVYAHLRIPEPAGYPDFERVFVGDYRVPGRWAPGRLFAAFALRAARRRLKARYGLDLAEQDPR